MAGLNHTLPFQRNKNVSSPHYSLFNFVWIFRDREVACSASDQTKNPVSVGQCHLTVLKRFSWPSVADMCTKVT